MKKGIKFNFADPETHEILGFIQFDEDEGCWSAFAKEGVTIKTNIKTHLDAKKFLENYFKKEISSDEIDYLKTFLA